MPITNRPLLITLFHPCSICTWNIFFSHVMPIHDKCSQRHDNFNRQTIWLLDILPWFFRAKSFTSCPVSKETEAMVTIRDSDELSRCSLKTDSGGSASTSCTGCSCSQSTGYYIAHFHYSYLHLPFWITWGTKLKCDLLKGKSLICPLSLGCLEG